MPGSTPPKIALLGAGSFVFSVGLLVDLIVDGRLQGAELALMDLDGDVAEETAALAGTMADAAGVEMTITSTTERAAALEAADFVTTAIAADVRRRWEADRAVLTRLGIRETMSECGGVGGLSYTLRQVPLVLGVARDMERLCPDAWLLNTSNPLPRVVTAVATHTTIPVMGFCNMAHGGIGGYVDLARLLDRHPNDLRVTSAGLNHFSWLLGVTDRADDTDLLPAVEAALAAGAWDDRPMTLRWWRRFGAVPLAGDPHTGEYLEFDGESSLEVQAHHGTNSERRARRAAVREVAAGRAPLERLLTDRSWERPGRVIRALATGETLGWDMLNLPNAGLLEGVAEDAVVEVPATIHAGTVTGVAVRRLPDPLRDVVRRVSRVHSLAAQAAVTGDGPRCGRRSAPTPRSKTPRWAGAPSKSCWTSTPTSSRSSPELPIGRAPAAIRSRILEDVVATDPTPTHGGDPLTVDFDGCPLPGRTTVGTGEVPRHLMDAGR